MTLDEAVKLFPCSRELLCLYEYPKEIAVDRGGYWYLPEPETHIGSNGVIIRKQDGKTFAVGSALNREAAFWAYERGILSGRHNLILTACVADLDTVIDILTKTPPAQRGMKITGRGREKWYSLLSRLPALVFSATDLHFYIHELMEAEREGIFTFETKPTGDVS